MRGLFIPEITAEMFRNGCLESIEALMAEGEIYDIEYDPKSEQPERRKGRWIEDVAYYDEEGCPCIVTRCDQCGEPGTGNYCSYCGADIRKEEMSE